MIRRLLALALGIILLQAGVARADEALTEAAEREKARRAGQKPQKVKRFTDDDLKKLAGKGGPAGAAAAATPAATQAPSSETIDTATPEIEQWQSQVDAARSELRKREAAVRELEARIGELRAEFSRPVRLNEANRERRIAGDIAALAAELEAARQLAEDARQSLDDVLEQARRAGIPASQFD
jgi:septal ring factor EnvC (AmiA/AmiB activator)